MCVDAAVADAPYAVHSAKLEAGSAARRCARTSLQVHGGTGGVGSSGVIPDGMILTPATNTVVTAGDVVHFMGHVMDAPAGQTMRYLWNFGNGSTSTALSPGDVVFNNQGTFNVSFTVIDASGLTDPTPAMRTITVDAILKAL